MYTSPLCSTRGLRICCDMCRYHESYHRTRGVRTSDLLKQMSLRATYHGVEGGVVAYGHAEGARHLDDEEELLKERRAVDHVH